MRNTGDSAATPSLETYSRGELATYSPKTLQLLQAHYLKMDAEGENVAEVILSNMVEQYGYTSLEHAEAGQKARRDKEKA